MLAASYFSFMTVFGSFISRVNAPPSLAVQLLLNVLLPTPHLSEGIFRFSR